MGLPIFVPRGHDPFGQHQELEPLAVPAAKVHDVKSDKSYWLKIAERILGACSKIRAGQRYRFLVLNKRIAASGDENWVYQTFLTHGARLARFARGSSAITSLVKAHATAWQHCARMQQFKYRGHMLGRTLYDIGELKHRSF